MSDPSALYTARHDHWRHPKSVPAPGTRCLAPDCPCHFRLPDPIFDAVTSADDDRTPFDLYDDVRTYMELAALWISVELRRRDPYDADGISLQEAMIERERVIRLYRARHPGHRPIAR